MTLMVYYWCAMRAYLYLMSKHFRKIAGINIVMFLSDVMYLQLSFIINLHFTGDNYRRVALLHNNVSHTWKITRKCWIFSYWSIWLKNFQWLQHGTNFHKCVHMSHTSYCSSDWCMITQECLKVNNFECFIPLTMYVGMTPDKKTKG